MVQHQYHSIDYSQYDAVANADGDDDDGDDDDDDDDNYHCYY